MHVYQESLRNNNNTVYKYTNKINSKVYIGRTMQDIKHRAASTGSGYKTCPKFWNAICKYGWENFELEILAENLSYEESVKLESYYINLYQSNTQEHGYNILNHEPNRGTIPDEVRKKISEARKHLTPEQRYRIGNSHRGVPAWNKGIKTGPLTDEQKKNFSKARKGNKNSIHVPVKDLTTGIIYRSGAEAGRAINRTSEAIFSSIKRGKPCNEHYFERVCEESLSTIESRDIEQVE